jgi:hypothetical protein
MWWGVFVHEAGCDVPCVVEMISKCAQCSDLSVIASVFMALTKLFSRIPDLIDIGIGLAETVVALPIPEFVEATEGPSILDEAKAGALDFIRQLVKCQPQRFYGHAESFFLGICSLIEGQDTGIHAHAIRCCAAIAVAYHLDANEIISRFSPLFESDDISLVSSLFQLLSGILVPGLELGTAQITRIVQILRAAQAQKLNCQDDYDLDLMRRVYKLWSSIASIFPDFFPLDQYISHLHRLKREKKSEELALTARPLACLYQSKQREIQGIAQRTIFDLVFSVASECDGFVSPDSLRAVRILIETDLEGVSRHIPGLFKMVAELLQLENEGQPTYNETYLAVVSLLFSLARLMGGTFPFGTFLDAMLNVDLLKSPRDGCNVVGCVCDVYEQMPEVFGERAPGLLRLLVQVCGMRRSDISVLKLESGVLEGVVRILRVVLSVVENAAQVVREMVGSESEFGRVMKMLE